MLSGPKIIIENGLWHVVFSRNKMVKNKDKFEPVYKFSCNVMELMEQNGANFRIKYENECQVSFSVLNLKINGMQFCI